MNRFDRALKVSQLEQAIQTAQAELEKIRGECDHPDFYVGMYSWRIASFNPSRICVVCEKPIAGITPAEAEKCWKESGFSDSTVTTTSSFDGPNVVYTNAVFTEEKK